MPGPLLDANNPKMTKIGCSWGLWTNRWYRYGSNIAIAVIELSVLG